MASAAEAEMAILSGVEKLAKEGASRGGSLGAQMLREAAHAYRAVVGGAQPGSVTVQK